MASSLAGLMNIKVKDAKRLDLLNLTSVATDEKIPLSDFNETYGSFAFDFDINSIIRSEKFGTRSYYLG